MIDEELIRDGIEAGDSFLIALRRLDPNADEDELETVRIGMGRIKALMEDTRDLLAAMRLARAFVVSHGQ